MGWRTENSLPHNKRGIPGHPDQALAKASNNQGGDPGNHGKVNNLVSMLFNHNGAMQAEHHKISTNQSDHKLDLSSKNGQTFPQAISNCNMGTAWLINHVQTHILKNASLANLSPLNNGGQSMSKLTHKHPHLDLTMEHGKRRIKTHNENAKQRKLD